MSQIFRISARLSLCHAKSLFPSDEVEDGLQRPLSVGMAEDATLLLGFGDMRLHLPNLRLPVHSNLRMPVSRRMASTAAMRSPIQRMTGTAIELPSAL